MILASLHSLERWLKAHARGSDDATATDGPDEARRHEAPRAAAAQVTPIPGTAATDEADAS